jgi:hypothetical protein
MVQSDPGLLIILFVLLGSLISGMMGWGGTGPGMMGEYSPSGVAPFREVGPVAGDGPVGAQQPDHLARRVV